MKKAGIPLLIAGIVLVVAGFVLLAYSGWGILLLLLGIDGLILGSVMQMAVKGQRKADYFDLGLTHPTDMPSRKRTVQAEGENVWDAMEQKQD